MSERETQENLAFEDFQRIVGDAAGVSADRVDGDSDLIELGLDSIRLMRLAGQLRKRGLPIRFSDLSAGQTVGAWWRLVSDAQDGDGVKEERRADARSEAEEESPFDFAVMQHAFWVGRVEGQELSGVSAHFYNEFDADGADVRGVEPQRLEQAVRKLFRRHGMLRMRVTEDGRQRIDPCTLWKGLQVHDLRGVSEQDRDRGLDEIRKALSHRIMDVSSGEVFDVQLSLLDGGATRMHVSLDMMAADAMSLRTLLKDLSALYGAIATEPSAPSYSYRSYLADREPVRRDARDSAAAWWRDRIPSLPGAPGLPVLLSEEGGGRPTVTRRHFWLSPSQKEEMARLARGHGLTPAAAFATAFSEVVARWSSNARFLLNLPVFDREPLHEEVDLLVGDFSSSVLLDADMTGTAAFSDRAGRMQSCLHEAISHAEYTGVEVLRDMTRVAGGETVLAPVVFTSALELGELFAPEVQNLFGRPSWIISQGPQVWLDAQVTELDRGILVNWDARDSLFPDGVLDAMFDAFEGLVCRLLEDEGAWREPAELPLPAGQLEVREKANDTSAPLCGTPLHDRFFRMAEASPDLPAVVWECGSCRGSMTYGQLSAEARRLASLLAANGIRKGSRVGITLPKGPEQIVAVLGVLAAGAAYVPSGVDVPMRRRSKVFESSGVGAVLVNEEGERLGWPASLHVLRVDGAAGLEPVGTIEETDPESEMYVLFTSGSTGEPKGVRVPHRAVANTICAVQKALGIGAGERTIALSALDFDLSVYDMFAFLATGGSVVALCESQRRDASAWAELIRTHGVTVVSCVPALLDMLLVAGAEQLSASALRLVMLGGDWVTVDLPGRLRSLVPGCRFAGLGGMTEAAIHTTVCEVGEVDPSWRSVPYGLPLSNMRCRVDDGCGRDCPDWVPGELWVSGAGVALGYDRDPERTSARFVERDSAIWYRTGDLARYWPDGTLEFLGRADDQVKIRGHRIELGEVEAQLAAHPRVKAAAAAVVSAAARQIVAAVVLEGEAREADLRLWLEDRLPSYMVPERIQVLDAFPITANGKIDRASIRDVLAASEGPSDLFEEPSGPVEQAVAEIWRELLGVERVGRGDGFFALGGDSLLATRLMRRLREALVEEATLASLFETPGLEDFSKGLRIGGASEGPSSWAVDPRPDERFEPFALTDVQRAYWIGRDPRLPLGGISPRYYLELDGAGVDLERLADAWNCLVRRHDMLRAVVSEDGMQRVLPEVPEYSFDIVESDDASFDSEIGDMRERLARGRSDPATWPLFGIGVVRRSAANSDARCRIGVALDSIAYDGRSIMVLFDEWERLYLEDAELPPLDVTFRDCVTQTSSSAEQREVSLKYWLDRVDGLAPAPQLPLAVDLATAGVPRFHRRSAVVEPSAWDAVVSRARGLGLTPTAVLLAAYVEVLAQWSGRADMTINLTLFDREEVHSDIDRVVGDFSSLLLVECEARGGDGFGGSARAVQRRLWDDLEHRQVSGVRVLRELARRDGATLRTMPVVFTSVLGLGDDASMEFSEGFPQPVYGLTQTPQVYLDLKVSQTSSGLSIDWDSADSLFAPGMCEGMFESYVELVRRLAKSDWREGIVSRIPAGQHAVRTRMNDTAGPDPESVLGKGLLHGAFFERASTDPGRIALVGEGGATTYGELAEHALRISSWLSGHGVEAGDTVAVDLPKGGGQVAALLGVLAVGATYLPIGRDLPAQRKERLVTSGNAALLIEDLSDAEGFDPAPGPEPVDASQTAYVIFTSGTTGEPKGVEISHRSAVNTIAAVNADFGVGPGDRVLAVAGVEFDLSVYDMFGLLSAGGAVVMIDEGDRRNAQRWLELSFEYGVTVWNSVPALLDMLATVAETESGLPESLRLALVSGDWVPLDLPVRVGAMAPLCEIVSLGGATEASIWSNAYRVRGISPGWASIPYGTPLRNQSFRVVDEAGRDCPDWVKGELWIGGMGLAQGYRGDSERTSEKFVMRDGLRWYRTGDTGRYWPDGTLEFTGRLDTQVKVRGHRIELGEVEAALTSYPGIERGVCVAPGERGRRWLAAFVQGVDNLEDLKRFLAEKLAPYEVPRQIASVDRLPLTSNGKVDRSELARRAAEAIGANGRDKESEQRSTFEPPTYEIEKAVADAWRDVLGVGRVGRGDDFFALGGDSLLATRLVSRLRLEGFADAELTGLFLAPTLAGFSETLSKAVGGPAGTIVPDGEEVYEPFGLTDVQQAYWVGRDPQLPLGGVAAQFYVEYECSANDAPSLEEAWNSLVSRHEMLRCVVDADGRQRILESVPRYEIATIESGDGFEGALESHREQVLENAPDPASWPLFDVKMLVSADGGARLCVSLDNLIVDGLSALTLFDEWRTLAADPSASLPPIGLTFRDYAVQAKPTPERLSAARAYWSARVPSLPAAPKLPLRVGPGDVGRPAFTRRESTMDASAWRKVTERVGRSGITPAAALLTCYADVLGRWSGQRDLTVNLTLFDRQPLHPDIDRVVGDFTSLMLVSCHAGGVGESWLSRARRVQEQIWRDLDHREVSGVAVMRELSEARGTAAGTMPIVFTSMLGVGRDLVRQMRWPDYTRSQTPQVWLDHQVVELGDGVLLSWDSVDALFPEGLVDEMFAEYVGEVSRLFSDDWGAAACIERRAETGASSVSRYGAGARKPSASRYEAPSGEAEKTVARLWGELLGVQHVSRNDGFFASGGDSLLATRLIAQLRAEGVAGGRLAQLLEGPTLAEFSATLSLGEAHRPPSIEAHPEHRHDPFPLTEVQEAYWLGRRKDFVLGGVPALFGVEREADMSQAGRIEEAWNMLVDRHEMLRAIVDADGSQHILPEVPRYDIPIIETGTSPIEDALAAIRGEMGGSTLDCGSWPLFDIRIVKGEREARLVAVFDAMVADGASLFTLLEEWDELAADPSRALEPLPMSFRDYVVQGKADYRRLEEAERYWFGRVGALPPGPALPLAADPVSIFAPTFRRLELQLDASSWQTLRAKARRQGVTPSVALLACYAETLAEASNQRDLVISLTLFDRPLACPGADRVVGDFTSLVLVECRLRPGDTMIGRLKRLQEQVWSDLDHREVSAMRVLREAASRGGRLAATVPVVFTSVLGLGLDSSREVGWPKKAWSQTPQVWLDHQAVETADGAVLTWDYVEGLFDPATIGRMFEGYARKVRRLADEDWAVLKVDTPSGVGNPLVPSNAGEAGPGSLGQMSPITVFESPREGIECELASLWERAVGSPPEGRTGNFFTSGGDSLSGTRLVQEVSKKYGVVVSLRRFFDSPTIADLARAVEREMGNDGSTTIGTI